MKMAFEFFKKIEREKWSGEVEVTSSQGNAHLLIKEGHLVWAHRPLDRAIERFEKIEWLVLPPPEILMGFKNWEALIKELLALNSENYTRFIRYLKTDRLEIFFRIFFWSNVELNPRSFEVTPPDPIEFNFYSPKKLQTLIAEAQRRLQEWPQIQERMGSSKRIFISRIQLPDLKEHDRDVVDQSLEQFSHTKGAHPVGGKFPFSIEEIELLKGCDGRNTVEDLIRKSQDGEFLVLRRLLELWKKSAIAPKDNLELVSMRRTKVLKVSMSQTLTLLWTIALTAGLLISYGRLQPPAKPFSSIPSTLIQAIELYRELNGHYPLSLSELRDIRPLSKDEAQAFVYSLQHPQAYDLKLKTP